VYVLVETLLMSVHGMAMAILWIEDHSPTRQLDSVTLGA